MHAWIHFWFFVVLHLSPWFMIAAFKSFASPCSPIFSDFNILKLYDIFFLKLLTFFYECVSLILLFFPQFLWQLSNDIQQSPSLLWLFAMTSNYICSLNTNSKLLHYHNCIEPPKITIKIIRFYTRGCSLLNSFIYWESSSFFKFPTSKLSLFFSNHVILNIISFANFFQSHDP